jgi:phospholipid/cholesterol/gamma-HCH transport system ATP-binding protein
MPLNQPAETHDQSSSSGHAGASRLLQQSVKTVSDKAALSVATDPAAPPESGRHDIAIGIRDLVVGFGEKIVLNHIDLDVYRGEILGIVGASGSGKSVLTRAILGLLPRRGGHIEVFGKDIDKISEEAVKLLECQWGVMFQNGALFSSLTVKENIKFPMREHLQLSDQLLEDMAMLKIKMVGLPADAADKSPAELSGGMTKRAALARALALDPEIVFLDEPTSGLDPIGAAEFDVLIRSLQKTLSMTVFMVTHDRDSLQRVCDRVAAISAGKVIAIGPIETMLASKDPWLRAYFKGIR